MSTRVYRATCGIAIVYVCLVTFLIPYGSINPGLDESWAWALNAVPGTNYVFGQDLVFTYGPLGFLLNPRPLGHNFQWAGSFEALIQTIFAAMLAVAAIKSRSRWGFLVFLAGVAAASALGMSEEYFYRLLVGLSLVLACLTSPWALLGCIIAGLLSPVLLMIKFSIGLAVASMVFVATMMLASQKAWSRIMALWVCIFLSIACCVFFFFRNIATFERWLVLSWEVARGYGAAMSVGGPLSEAIAGASLLALFLSMAVFLKGAARRSVLLFAIPALMALKHGFVGYTGMASGFFTFMPACASVLFLSIETRREWRLSGVFWLLAAALALYKGLFTPAFPELEVETLLQSLTGQAGIQRLQGAWNSNRLALENQGHQRLAQQRLSERWRAGLKDLPGVDVFPWELSYLPANDLRWRPSFVLQLYSAYTHALDKAMAERLGADNAPSALLIEFIDIFQRNMLLDTPLVFRELLSNWEPVEADYSRNLLWVRREQGRTPVRKDQLVRSDQLRFDEWAPVPNHAGKLFAQLNIRPNALGLIRQILWKTPPVYLRLEYESGAVAEFRMLPATASGGLLINYLPRSLTDLADLLNGYAFDRVTCFKIFGPGSSSFQPVFDVNWFVDDRPFVYYSPSQPRPAPQVLSVVQDGSGRQAGMVTVTARDAGGYRRLQSVDVTASENARGPHACRLRYYVTGGVLQLLKREDQVEWGLLGSPQVLENETCMVNLAESWPEFHADKLTLHLAIALNPQVHNSQRVFAYAVDDTQISSPQADFASWKPAAGSVTDSPWVFPPSPPSFFVTATRLPGPDNYRLAIRATDLNGSEDVDSAQIIINKESPDVRNACYVLYDAKSNSVSLMNDRGTAIAASTKVGSSSRISNSYCTIVSDSPLVRGRYDASFSLELLLTERMRNKRVVFTSGADRKGLQRGWIGAWLLSPP